ncbi:MAG: CbtB domain-containing protein [Hyphomicrobiaceae bacterium]
MQYGAQISGQSQSAGMTRLITRPVQMFAAMMLGMTMLYVAGFMQSSSVHNAAHDMRHTIGFPCH